MKSLKKNMTEDEKNLYSAFLRLETVNECFCFFRDLCTPAELKAMQERWKVCQLLYEEKLSYREINKKTGASLTTIGRVARFLREENYEGYKLVLERLAKKERISEK